MIQCRCFNLRKINPFFNMPVGAWIRGSYMWQPPNFSFPIRLCYERISVAKKSWENCLHVLSFPNSELLHFESGPSPSSDWQSLWQSFLQSGPSASSYETSFRTQHWCVQRLLACVLTVEAYFYGMVTTKKIPILGNLKRGDGTTHEFGSGTFRVWLPRSARTHPRQRHQTVPLATWHLPPSTKATVTQPPVS